MSNQSEETALTLLEKANISDDKKAEFSQRIVNSSSREQEAIAKGFSIINECSIPYEGIADLYNLVIWYSDRIEDMPKSFAALKMADISYESFPQLYHEAIEYSGLYADSSDFSKLCVVLKDAGIIACDENLEIYSAVVSLCFYNNITDNLKIAFDALKVADLPFEGNSELYYTVIDNAEFAGKLPAAFAVLKKNGISYEGNAKVCKDAILTLAMPKGYERLGETSFIFILVGLYIFTLIGLFIVLPVDKSFLSYFGFIFFGLCALANTFLAIGSWRSSRPLIKCLKSL
ncbi:MAG: hypothetical protein AB7R69_05875 [Candidatus Babeliales bacterium]